MLTIQISTLLKLVLSLHFCNIKSCFRHQNITKLLPVISTSYSVEFALYLNNKLLVHCLLIWPSLNIWPGRSVWPGPEPSCSDPSYRIHSHGELETTHNTQHYLIKTRLANQPVQLFILRSMNTCSMYGKLRLYTVFINMFKMYISVTNFYL